MIFKKVVQDRTVTENDTQEFVNSHVTEVPKDFQIDHGYSYALE